MRLKFQRGKQRELLQKFLLLEGLTTRKFESVYRCYVRNIITERLTLSKEIFDTLILIRPELKEYKHFIEKELPDNWGNTLGGKLSKPPVFKKDIICKVCGDNIISTSPRQVYCKKCAIIKKKERANHIKRPSITCQYCEKIKQPTGHKQRFCSITCGLKHSWTIDGYRKNITNKVKELIKSNPKWLAEIQRKAKHCISKLNKKIYVFLDSKKIDYQKEEIIGKYVIDILIGKKIIEADGEYWHSMVWRKNHDMKRDDWLKSQGFEILRIEEKDFKTDIYKHKIEDFLGIG